jgi:hypothetical protein
MFRKTVWAMVSIILGMNFPAWGETLSPMVVGCMGSQSGYNPGSDWFIIGNANADVNHMFVAVQKYSLNTLSSTVASATLTTTLSTNINSAGTNNYFLLQHYRYNNSGSLDFDDVNLNNASVDTINLYIASVGTYSWDVTQYVNADIAAGYSCSGFRMVLCDASWSGLPDDNGWQEVVFDLSPRLTISLAEHDFSSSPNVIGCIGANSGFNPGTDWFVIGNASVDANHMFVAVEKFPLGDIPSVPSAVLSNTVISTYNTDSENDLNYFIVQHYIYDNSVEICWDDATTTSVETISGVAAAKCLMYTMDVTSYVNQDIAKGYTHSAFRIVLTDEYGTPLVDDVENGQQIVSFDMSPTLTAGIPAPVFSSTGSEISDATQISITCSLSRVNIYYTVNGTTPTSTTGTLYTSAVTVNPGTTLKAAAVSSDGKWISDVTSVSYIAPLSQIDTEVWTFSNITVNNGGSQSWKSSTAISNVGTYYDYSYTISNVSAKMFGVYQNVTSYIPSENLTNSGSVEGTPPFDLRSADDPISGTFTILGNTLSVSATVHVYVDADGYLHVDISNVNLGSGLVTAARFSGTVTANTYARLTGSSPILSVSPTSQEVSADAGTMTFTVSNIGTGTLNWSGAVISGSEWVSITQSGDMLTLSYLANTSTTASRTAMIQITAMRASGSPINVTLTQSVAEPTPGDANCDGMVDVGDLGILAANYGVAAGAGWGQGDFNNDGAVDVGDLGILAANYGTNASSANWSVDYAKAFGTTVMEGECDEEVSSICSSLGLSLIAGLAMMGLMIVKLEE